MIVRVVSTPTTGRTSKDLLIKKFIAKTAQNGIFKKKFVTIKMVVKIAKNVIFVTDGRNSSIIQKIIKSKNVKIRSVEGKKFVLTSTMMEELQYLLKSTLKCIKKARHHINKIKNCKNTLISLKFNFKLLMKIFFIFMCFSMIFCEEK